MKDAKGHGSDARGDAPAHQGGVQQVGAMLNESGHPDDPWRGVKFGPYQAGDIIQVGKEFYRIGNMLPRVREERGDVAFSGQRFIRTTQKFSGNKLINYAEPHEIKPAKDPTK